MPKTILLCTVGSSHQPILKAIEETRPDRVCFFCTDRNRETAGAGSITQVSGKGKVISAGRGEAPALENLPTLAGLKANQVGIEIVPADDLDGAFAVMHRAMGDLKAQYPEARLVADYTGGTKSMAAALVTAVLESDGVDLQLVTGARADLNQVVDQTEYAITANIARIRLRHAMQPHLAAWERFAYSEAAQGLDAIPVPGDGRLAGQLNYARSLSRGFAAWDRFDHASALATLYPYANRIGESLGLHLKSLSLMVNPDDARSTPLRLYDLWLNAQRLVEKGRYDDAVARVYRLLEWTAQWQLHLHLQIATDNVPAARIPAGMTLQQNSAGHYLAGLFDAWRLLAHHKPDSPAAQFFRSQESAMLDHIKVRNDSILAHGFTPVEQRGWARFGGWIAQEFVPVLKEMLKADGGIRFDPGQLQLPSELPPGDA